MGNPHNNPEHPDPVNPDSRNPDFGDMPKDRRQTGQRAPLGNRLRWVLFGSVMLNIFLMAWAGSSFFHHRYSPHTSPTANIANAPWKLTGNDRVDGLVKNQTTDLPKYLASQRQAWRDFYELIMADTPLDQDTRAQLKTALTQIRGDAITAHDKVFILLGDAIQTLERDELILMLRSHLPRQYRNYSREHRRNPNDPRKPSDRRD